MRQIQKFQFNYNILLQSEALWSDFPELVVDPIETDEEFVKLMKLEPPDEGGLFFSLLFYLISDENIEQLGNLSKEELLAKLQDILTSLKEKEESNLKVVKVFVINKYLTLKLIGNKTYIYVNNKKFIQCKLLLMNILQENIEDYDEIRSQTILSQ